MEVGAQPFLLSVSEFWSVYCSLAHEYLYLIC
jgi:hypothetical protein